MTRFSVYLGIPAQGFRSILGNLAKLVGDLLRLAYLRRDRPRRPSEFKALVEGASTYSAVFGYWASEGQRVDDHSEVIEFLVRPENSAPIELLVISEVVFPALFLARQKEILLRIEHGNGASKRLQLVQLYDPALVTRLNPRASEPGPAPVDPLRWIRILLDLLTGGRLEPDLRGARPRGQEEGHLFTLEREFRSWKKQRGMRTWPAQAFFDFNAGEDSGVVKEIELPTIYIRLLLHASCWWAFFGASIALRRKYGRSKALWNQVLMTALLDELRRTLTTVTNSWMKRTPINVGPESDDPLANATLWLAFVHDFLVFCHARRGPAPGGADSAPYKNDDLSRQAMKSTDNLLPLTPTITARYFFPKLTTQLFAARLRVERVDRDTKEYWRECLGVLAKINDRHFPDMHLIHAWRMLFRFLASPCIDFCPDGQALPIVTWTGEIGPEPHVDWWTETLRRWRDCSTISQMWLSPLVLDAVEVARGEALDPPADPRVKIEWSVLAQLDREAIAGFPVKVEDSARRE